MLVVVCWDVVEVIGFVVGGDVDVDVGGNLFDGGFVLVFGNYVVYGLFGVGEIECEQGLLGGGVIGQEQYGVVVGNVDQVVQICVGLCGYGYEFWFVVVYFDDGGVGVVLF